MMLRLASAVLVLFATSSPPSLAQAFSGWLSPTLASKPSLIMSSQGQPLLVLMCEGTQIQFQVRGFVAAQQWPQPQLTLALGSVTRSKLPDLRLIGDETGVSISFDIADSVLGAISRGEPLRATFNGQEKNYAPPPEELRSEFSKNCAALVHPGMRAG